MDKKLSDIFDVEALKKECQECYNQVVNNFDDYTIEDNEALYRVETIGNSRNGVYQASKIIKGYNIPLTDEEEKALDEVEGYEFEWEIVKDFFNPIATEMNNTIKLQTIKGFEDYSFFFGNDENDGDYCLFISIEKSDEVNESLNTKSKTIVECAERYLEEDILEEGIEDKIADIEYRAKMLSVHGDYEKVEKKYTSKMDAFIAGMDYALEILQGKYDDDSIKGK
jgi:hypothetical protein